MDKLQSRAETKQKSFYLFWVAVDLNRTTLSVRMHERVAAAGYERETYSTTKQRSNCNNYQPNKWSANAQMSQPHDLLRVKTNIFFLLWELVAHSRKLAPSKWRLWFICWMCSSSPTDNDTKNTFPGRVAQA